MAQAKENIYSALNKIKPSIGKIEQRGDNPSEEVIKNKIYETRRYIE